MNILVAGASGFIGQKLVEALQADHHVSVLGRDLAKLARDFPKNISSLSWDKLSDYNASNYDVVINLCGYNISASRWNADIKEKIISSRVSTTNTLIDWIIKHNAKPHFICANAVGIYGLQENGNKTELDEDSPIDFEHPHDFMSSIGVRWEQALQPAIDYGLQVTTTRFGIVLDKNQGILKKLTPSFYLGMGAVIGDGKQIMSWVHIDDVVGALLFLIHKPELTGAFNLTAPHPISQAEFARSLASAMHRPLFLTLPDFAIRMLFGEMGECLLLKGQRVVPKRLLQLGYQFQYPDLQKALLHDYP